MKYLPVLIVFFVLASMAWAIFVRRRYAPNLERLLGQLKPPVDSPICSADSPSLAQQRAQDDERWKRHHGIRGVFRMFVNAGVLLTIATRIEEELGDVATQQHRRNSDQAIALRTACLASIAESLFLLCFPAVPIPRLIARFAFDQYCELCAYVRAMIEFHHPTLIDRFDGVI